MKLNKYASQLLAGAHAERELLTTAPPRHLVHEYFTPSEIAAAGDGEIELRPRAWAGLEGAILGTPKQRLRRAFDALVEGGFLAPLGDSKCRITERGVALGATLPWETPAVPQADASGYRVTKGVPEPRPLSAVEQAILEGATNDLWATCAADPRLALDGRMATVVVKAALAWRCVPAACIRWAGYVDATEDEVKLALEMLQYLGLLERRDRWGYDERANNIEHLVLFRVTPAALKACRVPEPPGPLAD